MALLPVLLPVDSRILEKNKEADIIYSEDNRENSFQIRGQDSGGFFVV